MKKQHFFFKNYFMHFDSTKTVRDTRIRGAHMHYSGANISIINNALARLIAMHKNYPHAPRPPMDNLGLHAGLQVK